MTTKHTTWTKTIAAVTLHALLAALVILPFNAQAAWTGPHKTPTFEPYVLDFWHDGELDRFEMERNFELNEDVPLVSGDMNIDEPGDLFDEGSIMVSQNRNSILIDVQGTELDLYRIGNTDWWTAYSWVCEADNDVVSCEWGFVGTVISDNFDLADAVDTVRAEYDPSWNGFAAIFLANPEAAAFGIAALIVLAYAIHTCVSEDVTINISEHASVQC